MTKLEPETSVEERVEANIRLVWYSIRKYAWWKAQNVSREDMFSWGMEGLFRAARLFDPTRGVKFSTYACCWIRGYLSRGLEKVRRLRRVAPNGVHVYAFGAPESRAAVALVDSSTEEPLDALIRKEQRDLLQSTLLSVLTRRERVVIHKRFFLGSTLRSVGSELDLSKERIRQIQSAALEKMRRSDLRQTVTEEYING